MKVSKIQLRSSKAVKIDRGVLKELKRRACISAQKRARVCLHRGVEDNLHQMVIALCEGCYISPHIYPNKSESFHIIEGVLKMFIFNDKGKVLDCFDMTEKETGGVFIYRIEAGVWHSVLPVTKYVIFHEITQGPFKKSTHIKYANWAPELDQVKEGVRYLRGLVKE